MSQHPTATRTITVTRTHSVRMRVNYTLDVPADLIDAMRQDPERAPELNALLDATERASDSMYDADEADTRLELAELDGTVIADHDLDN